MEILKRLVIHEVLIVITFSSFGEANLHEDQTRKQSVLSFCRSFRNCNDCKKASNLCDWCHDTGCTSQVRFHCPRKAFLDNMWAKNKHSQFCTEIITKSPLFVPAGVRQFIRLDMKIDDLTLYERNIMCEVNVDHRMYQVQATLNQNSVICEMAISKINKNVALGSLSLLWGGIEPYSNSVLLIVYQCSKMAQSCYKCNSLDLEFHCGWCQETNRCSLIDECPRRYDSWINRNSTCYRPNQIGRIPYDNVSNKKHYWLRAQY